MTELKGYMGEVLFLDLTNKKASLFPWTDADRKRTLGGKVMAADILYQHIRQGMKAYDEDNWVVVTTGPLTGSGCPNTSRFNISTISPLTNIITSSNCGGDFGLSLKRAGYDALIISGRSDSPVMVNIKESGVEFVDASDLWGLKISETQEKLPKKCGKLIIGPAGENKVLYSCVFSGERTAGRGGIGAVFGDKNLKGVTAMGTKTVEVFDRAKLKKFNKKWVKVLKTHPLTGRQLPKMGTAGLVSSMQARGILATKNFKCGRFENFEKVSGEELAEKHLLSSAACTSCVIRCARTVRVDGEAVKGPELETLGLFGPNILNDNIELILKWNKELDEYGIDTISCAGTVAFAMELKERGIWDNELEFGKTDNISEVFRKIAYREGIGDLLADGSKRLSDRFGGKEYAMHAKGMELAAYNPKRAVGQGLGYATANRGGCHLNAGYMVIAEGLGLDVNPTTPRGKAAMTIMFQNLMEAISAGGSCLFTAYAVFPGFLIDKPNFWLTRLVCKVLPYLGPVINILSHYPQIPQINIPFILHGYALNYVTGMRTSVAHILTWGARGYNLERISNIILGQKAGADKLPKALTDAALNPENPKEVVPLEVMKKEYYRARGWKDGIPKLSTLKNLGIDMDLEYYNKIAKEARD